MCVINLPARQKRCLPSKKNCRVFVRLAEPEFSPASRLFLKCRLFKIKSSYIRKKEKTSSNALRQANIYIYKLLVYNQQRDTDK